VCSNYHGFWGWLCDWQTLIGAVIAGLLAIGAAGLGGWMAYRAARDAAHGQIRALEQQNADLKRAEQRRLAQERSNIARVLRASMMLVNADITAVNLYTLGMPLAPNPVRKHGFDYLRERVGNCEPDEIITAFLLLEAGIDELPGTPPEHRTEQLDNLSGFVKRISDLARQEIQRTAPMLSSDETS
jgi:hypothetical protein